LIAGQYRSFGPPEKLTTIKLTYPYNTCTNNFRETLNESGGAVFLQKEASIPFPRWYVRKICYKTCITFQEQKQPAPGTEKQPYIALRRNASTKAALLPIATTILYCVINFLQFTKNIN